MNLEKQTMIKLINARVNGNFISLEDAMERLKLSLDQLDILIRVDAFRCFGIHKQKLLWEAYLKYNHIPKDDLQQRLFKSTTTKFALPNFSSTALEIAFDHLEFFNFTLASPFTLLEQPPKHKLLNADLSKFLNKTVEIYGYLVTAKNTSTSKGDQMSFGTFLDQDGHWIDTVQFPQVLKKYPFRGKGVYLITGKVVSEFDFLSIEVSKLERLPYVSDPRFDVTYNRKGSKDDDVKPFRLLR